MPIGKKELLVQSSISTYLGKREPSERSFLPLVCVVEDASCLPSGFPIQEHKYVV